MLFGVYNIDKSHTWFYFWVQSSLMCILKLTEDMDVESPATKIKKKKQHERTAYIVEKLSYL